MKKRSFFLMLIFLAACTSNTIYKKPKNLIPKDTMIFLLADLSIASTAYLQKNKHLQNKVNYISLVYEKYKIDSTRFKISNIYYMSKIEIYENLLKQADAILKTKLEKFQKEKKIQDSIERLKRKKRKLPEIEKVKYNKKVFNKIKKSVK